MTVIRDCEFSKDVIRCRVEIVEENSFCVAVAVADNWVIFSINSRMRGHQSDALDRLDALGVDAESLWRLIDDALADELANRSAFSGDWAW
jgi:hypothetical protein